MMSKYCFNAANEYRIKIGRDNKLVSSLGNKSKCCSLQKSSVVFVIRNEANQNS